MSYILATKCHKTWKHDATKMELHSTHVKISAENISMEPKDATIKWHWMPHLSAIWCQKLGTWWHSIEIRVTRTDYNHENIQADYETDRGSLQNPLLDSVPVFNDEQCFHPYGSHCHTWRKHATSWQIRSLRETFLPRIISGKVVVKSRGKTTTVWTDTTTIEKQLLLIGDKLTDKWKLILADSSLQLP